MKDQVDKYLTKAGEQDESMILTKDKGFKAVGKILSRVRKMRGIEQSDFLEKNFDKVWTEHDKDHNNSITRDDVASFYEDILKADKIGEDEQQEE